MFKKTMLIAALAFTIAPIIAGKDKHYRQPSNTGRRSSKTGSPAPASPKLPKIDPEIAKLLREDIALGEIIKGLALGSPARMELEAQKAAKHAEFLQATGISPIPFGI